MKIWMSPSWFNICFQKSHFLHNQLWIRSYWDFPEELLEKDCWWRCLISLTVTFTGVSLRSLLLLPLYELQDHTDTHHFHLVTLHCAPLDFKNAWRLWQCYSCCHLHLHTPPMWHVLEKLKDSNNFEALERDDENKRVAVAKEHQSGNSSVWKKLWNHQCVRAGVCVWDCGGSVFVLFSPVVLSVWL